MVRAFNSSWNESGWNESGEQHYKRTGLLRLQTMLQSRDPVLIILIHIVR